MGQITPIFKKDDELVKQNYRPVTVLPCLNNIFEKLLSASRILQWAPIKLSIRYRKFNSCETFVSWRTGGGVETKNNLLGIGIVSLDLSKAFDNNITRSSSGQIKSIWPE